MTKRTRGWRVRISGPVAWGGTLVVTGLLAAACGSTGTTAASSAPASSAPASSSASGSSAPASSVGTVRAAAVSGVGTVLVDSTGRTLYLFTPDNQSQATCAGACAQIWPGLDVANGAPVAGPGINASLLGTTKAPSGQTQVTYDRWPLYTFSHDSAPGEAHGQGLHTFGGSWSALDPSGQMATATSSTPTSPAPTSPPSSSATTSGGYGY